MQRGGDMQMDRGMMEVMMRMSTEFSTRALAKCSKYCVTNVKSATPTETEQTCLQNCFMKYMSAFGEGMKKMSEMMSGGSEGPQ